MSRYGRTEQQTLAESATRLDGALAKNMRLIALRALLLKAVQKGF